MPFRCVFFVSFSLLAAACPAGEPVRLKFKYLGVNRLPQSSGGSAKQETFAWSSGPLAFDPATDELLVMGHTQAQLAARIKPAPLSEKQRESKDVTRFPLAELVGEFHDPSHGLREKLQEEYGGQQFRITGLAFHQETLWLGFWRFYNVQNASLPGLAAIRDGKPTGVWFIGEDHSLKTSRYIAVDSSGRPYSGCAEGKASGNWGPALYQLHSFDLSLPHNGRQPAIRLMTWDFKGDYFRWSPPDQSVKPDVFHYGESKEQNIRPKPIPFNPRWTIASCAVLDDEAGQKQVVFAVSRPIGMQWYGDGIVTDGTTVLASPTSPHSRGYYKEGQVTSLIVFPKLIASKGRDRSYYEEPLHHLWVRDVAETTLTVDHKRRVLYLLESMGDWQSMAPILHVMSY
jgi:hypothetical protein